MGGDLITLCLAVIQDQAGGRTCRSEDNDPAVDKTPWADGDGRRSASVMRPMTLPRHPVPNDVRASIAVSGCMVGRFTVTRLRDNNRPISLLITDRFFRLWTRTA